MDPPKQDDPFWKHPAFWITLAILPLVYMVAGIVLLKDGYSNDLRTVVVTAIVSGAFGSITGFWLASSWNQNKQAAATAAAGKSPTPTTEGEKKP